MRGNGLFASSAKGTHSGKEHNDDGEEDGELTVHIRLGCMM